MTDTRDHAQAQALEEERFRILAREFNHRSQNLLVVVQSVIRMTQAPDVPTFVEKVEERITALARAHALVGRDLEDCADLPELVREELAPFGLGERVLVSGGSLPLTPKATQCLGMLLHELATNAAKYGALATADGQVELRWQGASDPSGELVLHWTERGGLPVTAPSRRGFGSALIEVLVRNLGGTIDKDWRLEGLVCTMRLPLRHCLHRPAQPSAQSAEQAAPPDDARAKPVAAYAAALPARNILVFETDTIVAQGFRHLIRVMGGTPVGPVTSQQEALHLARTAPIDVAILEAGLDGSLCLPIADALRDRGIPFVVCTCRDPASLCTTTHPDAIVLAKPFDGNTLGASLKRLMHRALPPDVPPGGRSNGTVSGGYTYAPM